MAPLFHDSALSAEAGSEGTVLSKACSSDIASVPPMLLPASASTEDA